MSLSPELPDPPHLKNETPMPPDLVGAGESHQSNQRPNKRTLTELQDEADENEVKDAEGNASDDQPEDNGEDGKEASGQEGEDQDEEEEEEEDESGQVSIY